MISKLTVGPMDNDVYVLRCPTTGDVVVVDGANEPERILAEVGDGRLTAVVQTHGHGDHTQALLALQQATGCRVLCHPDDAAMMPSGVTLEPIVDGDEVAVGAASLRAVHLAGHTPGGLAFAYDGDAERTHLFSGDSLFPGGVGRTTTPEEFASLMDAVEAKVFDAMPDSTWVYPGHGKDTTLGAERPSLPEWRARGW